MSDSHSSRPAGGVEDRELVERVAQAIWDDAEARTSGDIGGDVIPWAEAHKGPQDEYRAEARAAIKAVREAGSAGDADQLTPEQWKVVFEAASSYDRRLPDGQGDPQIPEVLRRLAGEPS